MPVRVAPTRPTSAPRPVGQRDRRRRRRRRRPAGRGRGRSGRRARSRRARRSVGLGRTVEPATARRRRRRRAPLGAAPASCRRGRPRRHRGRGTGRAAPTPMSPPRAARAGQRLEHAAQRLEDAVAPGHLVEQPLALDGRGGVVGVQRRPARAASVCRRPDAVGDQPEITPEHAVGADDRDRPRRHHAGLDGRVGRASRHVAAAQVVDDHDRARAPPATPTGPPAGPSGRRSVDARAAARAARPRPGARAAAVPPLVGVVEQVHAQPAAASSAVGDGRHDQRAATPPAPPRPAGRRGCAAGAAACGRVESVRDARPSGRRRRRGAPRAGDTSATTRPWRSTTMRSARSKTCSMRCDTSSIADARRARSRRMQAVDQLASRSRRAPTVGSSSSRNRGRPSSGPGDGDAPGAGRPTAGRPDGAGRRCRCRAIVSSSRGLGVHLRPRPAAPAARSRPRNRLATTSRLSHRARSCQTTPSWSPWRAGDGVADGDVAAVGAQRPAMQRTSVDLPAPFSPTSATSSPGAP